MIVQFSIKGVSFLKSTFEKFVKSQSRCLKITENVSFEFCNFGIFNQFLSCQNWPVWQHCLTLSFRFSKTRQIGHFWHFVDSKCKRCSLRSQRNLEWDFFFDFCLVCNGLKWLQYSLFWETLEKTKGLLSYIYVNKEICKSRISNQKSPIFNWV